MELYQWQKEALSNWSKHNYKGVVEAGTGTGKTQVGLEALKLLKCSTLVIVPTIELMNQWKEHLIKLKCPLDKIGLLGQGKSEVKKYTIGTFNSVRDLLPEGFELIIIDEIHHLPSDKNSKILEMKCKAFLGLTATLERNDMRHLNVTEKYPVVYSYSQREAIRDKIIAPYKIVPIYVDLTETEASEYAVYDTTIKRLFPLFGYNLRMVHGAATNYMHPSFGEAQKLTKAFNKRKEIILGSEERIKRTAELINEHCNYEKIIVFTESIDTANRIAELVVGNKFVYHSKLKKKERKEIYEKFKTCQNGVVISCKALEEGVDFPACKMGIVSGGSSQSRQAIQRTGRFLRKYGDMEAEVFDIVVRGTKDLDWFKSRYRNK